ncbi:hypothetical protein HHO41_21445 [Bacillus sp. DNRA2]|uniref:YkvI family membrane protein n=1 Tax=Bacillus sp. DNRA2 TaxID=2723053 RepID=UPI00145DD0A7|nr:hypothetical protein [Bacillus sp. DNRA2]NMD72790.1 hypothetical protein [Bacillus sp. DNRA2]
MKPKWSASFQIAAVYVGTVVGAGFATGREIVEFFTRFGFIGLIGIGISGSLLIYLGSKLLRMAATVGAHSYQEFNEYLFGRIFGRVINMLTLLMLLGVCAVMLSGAGAVFQEQLQLPKILGVVVTIILSLLVLVIGMKGLFVVNVVVVPMMISFSFILMVKSVALPGFSEQLMMIPFQADGWKAVVSPFSYAAFNLFLAQAVLVPVANEINDDLTLKWGGIIGGIALTSILICGHFSLIMLPQFESFEVPMAVIVKNIAAVFYWIYVMVIYGEIFTSVIGNVFGLERQLQNYVTLPSLVIISGIFLSCYFVSLVDYGELLSYLYPLFGYLSLAFIVLLWMKPLIRDQR